MPDRLAEPIPSRLFKSTRNLILTDGSAYLFALSVEERSRLTPDWMQRNQNTVFVEILPDESSRASFNWQAAGESGSVRLRSEAELDKFFVQLKRPVIYLDITGLPHFVWLPVLRAALRLNLDIEVVYAEPQHYMPRRNSPAAELYQLSDQISNAEPLPGFASLGRDVTPPILVSLLGFEGGRFARVQEIVQTTGERTFPIIGVPGFEPEYPFIAYFANRLPLREGDCWMNLGFANASCPFALLAQLEYLAAHKTRKDQTIKVAMIGTKPHALGALLFFLRTERDVELVYDHPVRSAGRTKGSTRCWLYSVSKLTYRKERLTSLQP